MTTTTTTSGTSSSSVPPKELEKLPYTSGRSRKPGALLCLVHHIASSQQPFVGKGSRSWHLKTLLMFSFYRLPRSSFASYLLFSCGGWLVDANLRPYIRVTIKNTSLFWGESKDAKESGRGVSGGEAGAAPDRFCVRTFVSRPK